MVTAPHPQSVFQVSNIKASKLRDIKDKNGSHDWSTVNSTHAHSDKSVPSIISTAVSVKRKWTIVRIVEYGFMLWHVCTRHICASVTPTGLAKPTVINPSKETLMGRWGGCMCVVNKSSSTLPSRSEMWADNRHRGLKIQLNVYILHSAEMSNSAAKVLSRCDITEAIAEL